MDLETSMEIVSIAGSLPLTSLDPPLPFPFRLSRHRRDRPYTEQETMIFARIDDTLRQVEALYEQIRSISIGRAMVATGSDPKEAYNEACRNSIVNAELDRAISHLEDSGQLAFRALGS